MKLGPADLKVGDVIQYQDPDGHECVTDEVTHVQKTPDGNHIIVTRTGRVDLMIPDAAVHRLDTADAEGWRAEQAEREARREAGWQLRRLAGAIESGTAAVPTQVTVHCATVADWEAAAAALDATVHDVRGLARVATVGDPLAAGAIALTAWEREGEV